MIGSSIPPAPPMMGSNGPPPPPFGLRKQEFAPPVPQTQGPPTKATNLSSKPLKTFNWVKIAPTKVKDTLWENINEEDIHAKLKGEAYSQFEELFAAKETKIAEKGPAKADIETPKEITFLDGKRSQNISNLLIKRRYHA
jgi:dishevelled associated activator of morphogenesis